jgi:hypothetical protein
MVGISHSKTLKVSLQDPMRSASGHKTIRVTYGGGDNLDIPLRRTVRVPGNGTTYDLPPDCGPFPIYSVKDYKSQLPKNLALKGGLFVPIYGKCSPFPFTSYARAWCIEYTPSMSEIFISNAHH